jgi:hypothetical protein
MNFQAGIRRQPLIFWPVRFQGRHIVLFFCIACFGVLPFVFSGQLLDPARYPQMVVLCVGIAALLLPLAKPTVSQSDAPSAAVSKVSFLMLALALWTGLSMFWALNKAEAWFSFLQLSLGFAFFHLSRKAFRISSQSAGNGRQNAPRFHGIVGHDWIVAANRN